MKKTSIKKVKNFILKSITNIMIIIFLICLCADTHTKISFMLLAISGLWLGLMAWANGYIN